jgi:hypothetical protein
VLGKSGKDLLDHSGYKSNPSLWSAKRRARVKDAIQRIREQRMLDLGELAAKGQKMLSDGLNTVNQFGDPGEKMRSGGAALKLVADVNGKLPARAQGYTQSDVLADLEQRRRSLRLHLAFALRSPKRATKILAKLLDSA